MDLTQVLDVLGQVWNFLVNLVLWIPRSVVAWFVDGTILGLQALPDPCCVAELISEVAWLRSLFSGANGIQVGENVIYFSFIADVLQLHFGIAATFCTLLARFLLRRIPGVG